MRDVSQKHSGAAFKKGPMTDNEDAKKISENSKMVDASKNLDMAKTSKSGTKV